ncbi:exopolyphosphatase [Salibacterium aidingense]|uniref:exopolyphosphatase n=1 Tax=Salibacterium aidingense TaxID=384933 RepID=UPI003BE73207
MRPLKEKVAVIDIGSNSIRLVINELDDKKGTRELHNLKQVARLSNYIDENYFLTAEGMKVLKESLQQFEEVLQHHHVTNVKAVATAAIRNAANKRQILDLIHRETSLHVRVLSEEEEAYYGYLAVINSTSHKDGISIDIGGGSTEITVFKNKKLQYAHSFPFGALTLKKKFFPQTEPSKQDLKQLSEYVLRQLDSLTWLKEAENLPVIGIGGSARNMSLVHQAQTNYPLSGLHQYEMKKADISSMMQLFENADLKERENIEGLSKDRADVIIPAVRVIYELADYISSNDFMMSSKGLREGLFFEEMLREHSADYFPEVTEESFFQLSREFEMNESYVQEVGSIARQLYTQLQPCVPNHLKEADNMTLLKKSARVLYIGEFISHETSSQHTFYVLTNRSIDGIPHSERLAMSFIASFKSKSWMKRLSQPFQSYVSKKEFKRYELLGSILKLAYALDRTKRKVVESVTVEDSGESLDLYIWCKNETYSYFEEVKSNKYKKHVEKVLKRNITLHFHPITELNKTFTF